MKQPFKPGELPAAERVLDLLQSIVERHEDLAATMQALLRVAWFPLAADVSQLLPLAESIQRRLTEQVEVISADQ